MTTTWYPVIDDQKCIECGSCINMCPNGVYDQEKMPLPVIKHPEKCGQGCHGCGDICPAGAIKYAGDDFSTGKEGEKPGCTCGGACSCGDRGGECCE